jgi:hypothetical protein
MEEMAPSDVRERERDTRERASEARTWSFDVFPETRFQGVWLAIRLKPQHGRLWVAWMASGADPNFFLGPQKLEKAYTMGSIPSPNSDLLFFHSIPPSFIDSAVHPLLCTGCIITLVAFPFVNTLPEHRGWIFTFYLFRLGLIHEVFHCVSVLLAN